MQWAIFLIIFVATAAISIALAPKAAAPKPDSLEDLNVPTAEPGRPIPVVFGTVVVKSPNVVWYGDLLTTPVKTKSGK